MNVEYVLSLRLEAIASRLEAVASRWEAIPILAEQSSVALAVLAQSGSTPGSECRGEEALQQDLGQVEQGRHGCPKGALLEREQEPRK